MNYANLILTTENKEWGFWGTMASCLGDRGTPRHAWDTAFVCILGATGADADSVRAFLDSKHGRHFADTVLDAMAGLPTVGAAIESAIDTWQGWRVGVNTAKHYGMPASAARLNYLDGLVTLAGIEDDF